MVCTIYIRILLLHSSCITIFEGNQIRRYWDAEKELWYFAVTDIIHVLAQTDRSRKYWNDLKVKLKKEGLEFAILTNEITQAWAGLTTKQYKNLKGIKK